MFFLFGLAMWKGPWLFLFVSGCVNKLLGSVNVSILFCWGVIWSLSHSPCLEAQDGDKSCYFATFSPAASSCGPAMVRVFGDCDKHARPVLTKGLFSSAAWVTMKWEPSEGKDLLLLVHSSELTEEDLAFRRGWTTSILWTDSCSLLDFWFQYWSSE